MMMVAAPVMVVAVIVSVGVMVVRVSHGAYVSPTSGPINAITSNDAEGGELGDTVQCAPQAQSCLSTSYTNHTNAGER